jgi:hypothetical protein
MTDLEKATNELINALDLIKGNKAFDRKLVIETALEKYAESKVKKLNIPAVMVELSDSFRNFIRTNHLTAKWEQWLKDTEGN